MEIKVNAVVGKVEEATKLIDKLLEKKKDYSSDCNLVVDIKIATQEEVTKA